MLTVGNRLQLALRPPFLGGALDESQISCLAEFPGESSHSLGRKVRTLSIGESVADFWRSGVWVRRAALGDGEPREGESGVLLHLLAADGEGGGFGLHLTFAHIGMWRSAAFLSNCLEQCGQVTEPGAGPRAVVAGETASPRACLQIV